MGGMLALREAKTSIKIITNEYARYWRNGYPEQFMQLHFEALARVSKSREYSSNPGRF